VLFATDIMSLTGQENNEILFQGSLSEVEMPSKEALSITFGKAF